MSTAEVKADAPKPALSLVDKQVRKAFIDPLVENNPVTVQILGVCSSLAVTTQVKQALLMGLGVTLCTALGNVVLAAMRNYIPSSIRIIVQLAVISVLVICLDEALKAYVFDLEKKLSVFIGLIITNCILMGRAEAYAMSNPPWPSFVDGVGNGLGYTGVLLTVATVREIFGSGTWFGAQVVPQAAYDAGYVNNGMMVLAPGAFVLLGLLIWGMRTYTGYRES
jgi:Na+-transporting NADH:ubiquinone oxidoreductase subunit D